MGEAAGADGPREIGHHPGRWETALAWAPALALYLVTRLFGASRFWELATDQVTYLIEARTFPFHRVYNDQLYLIHPPLWGYVIGVLWRLLRLFEVDLAHAGLLASVAFVFATFFVTRPFARHLRLGPVGTAASLLYLTLSLLVFGTQWGISRFPILVTEMGLCLLWFDRYLNTPSPTRTPWKLIALTAVTMLTADNALALLPCYAWLFLLTRGARAHWRGAAAVFATALLAGAIWPAFRLAVYASHDTYPAGISGTIEVTRPIPWPGVLQPNLLPITQTHNAVMGTGFSTLQWKRAWDFMTRLALPPAWPSGRWLTAIVAIAALLRGLHLQIRWDDVRASIADRAWRDTAKLAGLTAILALPMLTGLYPWYAAPYAVPFAVLLGRGADGLLDWNPWSRRAAVGGFALLSVGLSIAWVTSAYQVKDLWAQPLTGPSFLFTRPPMTPGEDMGPALATLHLDPHRNGIMMPVGRSESLVYATGFRTICVPFDPTQILPTARAYHITHVIIPKNHLIMPIGGPKARRWSGWDALHYIDTHPDQFRPVATPVEHYADGRSEPFRIYEVRDADR